MSRAHPLRLFMRRSRSSELPAYGALLTAAIVWGGSVVGQKYALGWFSAVEVSVLRGLGLEGLGKTENTLEELRRKGLS